MGSPLGSVYSMPVPSGLSRYIFARVLTEMVLRMSRGEGRRLRARAVMPPPQGFSRGRTWLFRGGGRGGRPDRA